MSIRVCEACEAKVKVPEGMEAKALKCPKCKEVMRPKAALKVPPRKTVEEDEDEAPVKPKKRAAVEDDDNEAPPVKSKKKARDDDDDEEEGDAEDGGGKKKKSLIDILGGPPDPKKPFARFNITKEVQKDIKAMFTKEEKIVWVGVPARTFIQYSQATCVIGGSVLLALGLAVAILPLLLAPFWIGMIFAAVGLFFAGGGVAVFFARRIIRWQQRKAKERNDPPTAVYVLTDFAAYVWDSAIDANEIFSYGSREVRRKCEIDEDADGNGNVVFEVRTPVRSSIRTSRRAPGDGPEEPPTKIGFLDVEHVRDLEKLVKQTLGK